MPAANLRWLREELGHIRAKVEKIEEKFNNIENHVIELAASLKIHKAYLALIIVPIIFALIYALLK